MAAVLSSHRPPRNCAMGSVRVCFCEPNHMKRAATPACFMGDFARKYVYVIYCFTRLAFIGLRKLGLSGPRNSLQMTG